MSDVQLHAYNKPPLTFKEQAERLKERGLQVDDHQQFVQFLSNVNYYRFTGYLYHLRIGDGEYFDPAKAHFNLIQRAYYFDEELRILIFKQISKIEVAFKTHVMNFMSLKTKDPFFYKKENYLPLLSDFDRYLEILEKEIRDSSDIGIIQFRKKYDITKGVPSWIVCEIMSFGSFIKMFAGLEKKIQKKLLEERNINLPRKTFNSWIQSISALRNICAHHGQLWNKKIYKNKPKLYIKYLPAEIDNETLFFRISILNYLLYIFFKNSDLKNELHTLLEKYHDAVEPSEIGAPENWQESQFWELDVKS